MVELICKWCGKKYHTTEKLLNEGRGKGCSKSCSSKLRVRPPMSEETKKKIGNAHRGRIHTQEARKNMGRKIGSIPWNKGKQNLLWHGSTNPRWNNGATPLNHQIRWCKKMCEWRSAVFERDNYKDWFSGCTGKLEAHHIVSFYELKKKYNIKTYEEALNCAALWDVNNGVTMLKSNHRAFHDMWGTKGVGRKPKIKRGTIRKEL